jgi:putative nucleotidyltransferase with HDIG domain
MASYRLLALEDEYLAPSLTLVMSISKSYVLQPIALFRRVFPFIILMSLLVVTLLSFGQIRRNLIPLERLKVGTERIAKREFDSRVTVSSKDEFEDLAESFNAMADRLGRQFKALVTIGEIDRSILSALDTKRIADTAITRMSDVVPCDAVSAALLDSKDSYKAEAYIWVEKPHKKRYVETVEFKPEDIQTLQDNEEFLFIEPNRKSLHYLKPMARRGFKSFLVLPIFLKKKLAGTITLGYLKPPIISQEDVDQVRRFVNQVAVAISNARLIEELHDLNWGALTALARAIDAKSPWTAGHSERVTKLALEIGRVMRLPKKELDNLHRGGLMHDLGKIGIPPEVLDKPGKLTAEEMRLMHKHVQFGVRILKPIAAYAEVIPIVEQHHERFDGAGYPNGLAGEDISLGGLIFSVADDFDALSTDRPYRKALPRKRIINLIKDRSGSKYNPKVVEAFLEVMDQEEREEKQK